MKAARARNWEVAAPRPQIGVQGMSDADDYIHAIERFEKLRHEYLEWLTQADRILNLLRHVDVVNTDGPQVLGDQLRASLYDPRHSFIEHRSFLFLYCLSPVGDAPRVRASYRPSLPT